LWIILIKIWNELGSFIKDRHVKLNIIKKEIIPKPTINVDNQHTPVVEKKGLESYYEE